jgi:hypothetical protein
VQNRLDNDDSASFHLVWIATAISVPVPGELGFLHRVRITSLSESQAKTLLLRAYHLLQTDISIKDQAARDAEAVALLSLLDQQPFESERNKSSVAHIKREIEDSLGKPIDSMERFIWQNTLYSVAWAIE